MIQIYFSIEQYRLLDTLRHASCGSLFNNIFDYMIDKNQCSCIVDRYFYESYRKLEEKKAKSVSYYIVRTFALVLTIPINHFVLQKHNNQQISLFTIFLVVALAYTALQTCFSSYFYCCYIRNLNRIIKIAIEYRHSFFQKDNKSRQDEAFQEDMHFSIRQDILGLRVSSAYYDFQNMQKISDVSEDFKSMRQSNGCSMINGILESSMGCYKLLNGVFMFFSIFIFAFGLTVGSIAPLNQTQHSLLEMVLISQLLFQPRVYAIILLIGLLPVGIIVACIYCCCCGVRGAAKAKLPQMVKATPECISKCAQCSICFQGIVVDEEVAVLPCSEMHVFHYTCIEGWTKMKPNCPNCRHLLT